VELRANSTGLRVEPIMGEESLDERAGRLVIPDAGRTIDDKLVRSLRDVGRR